MSKLLSVLMLLLAQGIAMAQSPQITQPPVALTVTVGQDAQFTVVATGSNLTYKWLKGGAALSNGGRISGASGPILTVTGALQVDAGSYSVVVSVSGSPDLKASSDGVLLKVNLPTPDPPVITQDPSSQSVAQGQIAQFTVTASGSNLVYQWFKSGKALINGGRISGATTATLKITGAQLSDGSSYSVKVSISGFPDLSVSSDGVSLLIEVPEIEVEQTLGTSLVNGAASINFGSLFTNSTAELNFTVKNTGDADLTGLTLARTGTGATMFSVITSPVTPVIPGGSTTFTVRFAPTSEGAKTAVLHIGSNDPATNPFNITLTGTGMPTSPGKLALGSALFSVNEEAGSVTIPVIRSGGADGAVSVVLSTKNGSALASSDYTSVTNQLVTFVSGDTTVKNVSIPILNPSETYELTESFSVSLSAPTGKASLGTLKTATIVILDSVDTTPPVAPKIVAPLVNARVNVATAGAVTVTGTATDNQKIGSVEASLDNGVTFSPATVTLTGKGVLFGRTATYTVNLTPPLGGTHSVQVRCMDMRGNVSEVSSRLFVVNRPLGVNISGSGKVTAGFTPSSFREIGKGYAITATPLTTPAPGFVFKEWTVSGGPTPAQIGVTAAALEKPTLSFIFREDLVLTANFIANPFTAVAGTYLGTIRTTPQTHASSGVLKVVLTGTGSFTGTLTLGGATYGLKSIFYGKGLWSAQIARSKKTPLTLSLVLDLANGSDTLKGLVSDGVFTSSINTHRSTFKTGNACPQQGRYTIAIDPETSNATAPTGYGYATFTVDANGNTVLAGKLGDGTALTSNACVSKVGTWPLYLALYGGTGCVMGEATFAALAESDAAADLYWFKPARPSDAYFKTGFETIPRLSAQAYAPPAIHHRALPGWDAVNGLGTAEVSGAGLLVSPLLQPIALSIDNKVTSDATVLKSLVVTIVPSTGSFSGSFLHPDTKKTTKHYGALLQKTNEGVGVILGATTTGNVLLAPQP
jgi:hypothetical protein